MMGTVSERSTKSIQLCRIAGIPVRTPPAVPAFLFYGAVFTVVAASDRMRAARLIVSVSLVLLSVLWHELAHALAARRLGLAVEDIRLHALVGMARVRTPRTPREEYLVAAAGPAGSLALAGLAALADRLIALVAEGDGSWIARNLVLINLFIGLLNLVPAFPMDGGRILRAAFAARWGLRRATGAAVNLGRLLALGMILAPLADLDRRYLLGLPLVGAVVLVLGERERRRVIASEAGSAPRAEGDR
jgi:Zn-dependent protease